MGNSTNYGDGKLVQSPKIKSLQLQCENFNSNMG